MKRIILFLFPIVLLSCKGGIKLFDNDEKDLYTLVYVDLSRSLDSSIVNKTAKNVVDLYNTLPDDRNSTFIVRPIDKDISGNDLFMKESQISNDIRHFKVQERDSIKKEDCKRIESSIKDYFRQLTNNRNSGMESCICNSLENSCVNLSAIDTAKTEIRLIVFSDMFEECSEKSTNLRHDMYFCSSNKQHRKGFDSLKVEIQNKYSPNSTELISQYVKPENLFFILNESNYYNNHPDYCLNTTEIKQLWVELLVKIGYDRDLIGRSDGVTYTSKLTNRMKFKD